MEYVLGGEAPFQVLSPRQGRPNWANRLERTLFRKISTCWCHGKTYPSVL